MGDEDSVVAHEKSTEIESTTRCERVRSEALLLSEIEEGDLRSTRDDEPRTLVVRPGEMAGAFDRGVSSDDRAALDVDLLDDTLGSGSEEET